MNQLTKVFNFNNNQVRVLTIKGKPWFVGNDVAKTLGFKNYRGSLNHNVDNDDKLRTKIFYAGQNRMITFINEPGVYNLIFHSRIKSAKRFKHWFSHEVLPSIRKTGSYGKPNYRLPKNYLEAMELATASLRKNKELQPQADEYQKFIKNPGTMTITSIAKDFGMTAHQLNLKLHDLGVIYKNGKTWFLYKKYQNMGLAHYDEYRNGNNRVVSTLLKWTTYGKKFIYNLLAKQGIHLLTEKQGFGNMIEF